jgi:membrane-associated phospholipid phosphatase
MKQSIDQRLSRKIFEATKKSWVLRHLAVFCADDLIWLLVGIGLFSGISSLNNLSISLVMFFGTLGIPWLVTAGISRIVKRPRPYDSQEYKPIIRPFIGTYTFPSSHATFAFALAAFAATTDFSNLFIWFLIGAIFIAFGRVAVGVHYISDIIVGAVIGSIGAAIPTIILISYAVMNSTG